MKRGRRDSPGLLFDSKEANAPDEEQAREIVASQLRDSLK
jgi:hypothetical protein